MFTEKHYLENISGEQLDAYLDRGWYRMGQSVFTCRFLIFRETLYSAIWVRLPLESYSFSKSKRKKVRQIERQFSTVIRPLQVTAEKEVLYHKYRKNFPARIAPTLTASLLDGTEQNIFNSYEVCVYDKDELVAFSVFDLGQDALASILGVYHPDYARHSLGFYTMLQEIRYGMEKGFRNYYPGYVVPGYPKFNYKLQIGEVEYFRESTHSWHPYSDLDEEQLPEQQMEGRLKNVQEVLRKAGYSSQLYLYPPYEANLLGYWILDYLDYPLILEIEQPKRSELKMILTYDFRSGMYQLTLCSVYDNLNEFFRPLMSSSSPRLPVMLELLIREELIAREASEKEIIAALRNHPGGETLQA